MLRLSTELKHAIASYLDRTEDRLSMIYACHTLYLDVIPLIYRHFSVGLSSPGWPFTEASSLTLRPTNHGLRHIRSIQISLPPTSVEKYYQRTEQHSNGNYANIVLQKILHLVPSDTLHTLVAEHWELDPNTVHCLSMKQTRLRTLSVGDVVPPLEVKGPAVKPVYNPRFSHLHRLRLAGNPERKLTLYRTLLQSPRLRQLEILSSSLLSERFSYSGSFIGLHLPLEALSLHQVALDRHGSTFSRAIDIHNLQKLEIWSCTGVEAFLESISTPDREFRLKVFLCHGSGSVNVEPFERILRACHRLECVSIAAATFDRPLDAAFYLRNVATSLEDLTIASWWVANPASPESCTISGVSEEFWINVIRDFANLRTVRLVLPDTYWAEPDRVQNARFRKCLAMVTALPNVVVVHCDRGSLLQQRWDAAAGEREYPVTAVCDNFTVGPSYTELWTDDQYYIAAKGANKNCRCTLPIMTAGEFSCCADWPRGIIQSSMTAAVCEANLVRS